MLTQSLPFGEVWRGFYFMLITLLHNIQTASALLSSGFQLARNLKKEFGVLTFVESAVDGNVQKDSLEKYFSENGFEDVKVIFSQKPVKQLAEICEENEASFLMIQWSNSQKKQLKNYLKYCRDLRIPYLFFKDEFTLINFEKVLVPVGFLIEDYEKTQFASAFGRFCGSEITILQANDYGSKAKTTVEKMKLIFDKFDFEYKVEKAKSDSFKFDKEGVLKAEKENYGVVLVSASRDYGLDDVIFGPKELHLVKKSPVPLLLINPRGDLYTLCD